MKKTKVFINHEIKQIEMTDRIWSLADMIDSLIESHILSDESEIVAWYRQKYVAVQVNSVLTAYIPHIWQVCDE